MSDNLLTKGNREDKCNLHCHKFCFNNQTECLERQTDCVWGLFVEPTTVPVEDLVGTLQEANSRVKQVESFSDHQLFNRISAHFIFSNGIAIRRCIIYKVEKLVVD